MQWHAPCKGDMCADQNEPEKTPPVSTGNHAAWDTSAQLTEAEAPADAVASAAESLHSAAVAVAPKAANH